MGEKEIILTEGDINDVIRLVDAAESSNHILANLRSITGAIVERKKELLDRKDISKKQIYLLILNNTAIMQGPVGEKIRRIEHVLREPKKKSRFSAGKAQDKQRRSGHTGKPRSRRWAK